jgi:CRP-like cAMP-binding protein
MFSPLFKFLRLFKDISSVDEALIAESLTFRSVKEGEILLNEGSYAKEFFFISKGILKITSWNDKDVPVIKFFLKENQFCTILNSFINEVPAEESIVAACDAELIVFSRDSLFKLYMVIPYFRELITGISQQALMDKIQIRNSYLGEGASTRYRNFLIRQPDIALRVPLGDVASYLGVTQQSLSRIRKSIQ